jgi:F0F1-type ATP synthase assembly protein I
MPELIAERESKAANGVSLEVPAFLLGVLALFTTIADWILGFSGIVGNLIYICVCIAILAIVFRFFPRLFPRTRASASNPGAVKVALTLARLTHTFKFLLFTILVAVVALLLSDSLFRQIFLPTGLCTISEDCSGWYESIAIGEFQDEDLSLPPSTFSLLGDTELEECGFPLDRPKVTLTSDLNVTSSPTGHNFVKIFGFECADDECREPLGAILKSEEEIRVVGCHSHLEKPGEHHVWIHLQDPNYSKRSLFHRIGHFVSGGLE